ncbi:MAG: hypothetical protein U0Q16_15285 [Bryobacteraceae bacterium]
MTTELFLLLYFVAQAGASTTSSPVLSVCDVLASRDSLSGSMIVVRGIEIVDMEFHYLMADGCDGPIDAAGTKWDPSIAWAEPGWSSMLDSPAPFKFDRDAANLIRLQARNPSLKGEKRMVLVVEGRLEARRPLRTKPTSGGRFPSRIWFGYGGQGIFPAQIVVKRVISAQVVLAAAKEPTPTTVR